MLSLHLSGAVIHSSFCREGEEPESTVASTLMGVFTTRAARNSILSNLNTTPYFFLNVIPRCAPTFPRGPPAANESPRLRFLTHQKRMGFVQPASEKALERNGFLHKYPFHPLQLFGVREIRDPPQSPGTPPSHPDAPGVGNLHLYSSLNPTKGISLDLDAKPDNVRPKLVPLGCFVCFHLRKIGARNRKGGKSEKGWREKKEMGRVTFPGTSLFPGMKVIDPFRAVMVSR
ncbi:hypothetical protein AVEN_152417-1 [Araneus ventricosus]|uniref:Uncharacterized protein n=1 Tax=Araneus ventricosus TaxID=182803 RepID=A0A4Y2G9S9_ARAVE|nr:hypothetical protein AVEN_152417-1 [Araneus ventricosus]